MKITIRKETVAPMTAWLKAAREQGIRDEKALREILSMPDYGVEFQRYAEPNLPVCGIGFEEAVDFFLHFDEKERLFEVLLSFDGFPDAWKEAQRVSRPV